MTQTAKDSTNLTAHINIGHRGVNRIYEPEVWAGQRVVWRGAATWTRRDATLAAKNQLDRMNDYAVTFQRRLEDRTARAHR